MTVPVSDLIAARGIDVPGRAMPLLADMTGRFSCEWAVRPFIAHDPGTAFALAGALDRRSRRPRAPAGVGGVPPAPSLGDPPRGADRRPDAR